MAIIQERGIIIGITSLLNIRRMMLLTQAILTGLL